MTEVSRTDCRFRSGDADCVGWLFRPEGVPARRPAVVMAHGLGAVKEMGLEPYARGFAEAGYVVVVFDYRHFGASGGEPRQLLDIGRQRADYRAAVAWTRGLEGVDPDRVTVFGTSFSGGHAIVTASADPRIAAAIAQCPFTDGVASALRLGPLPTLGVTALGLLDAGSAIARRPPVTVHLAGRPGEVALMNRPDVMEGYRALVPDGFAVRGDVAARIGLWIALDRPGGRASRVACPILFCVCDRDSVAPAGPTLRFARRARRGEVRRYDVGHFEIYRGEAFRRAFADQLNFLRRHVPVT